MLMKLMLIPNIRRRGDFAGGQWLTLYLPMHRVQVPPLVGELRSHMHHDRKTQNTKNIVTNSIKMLTLVHTKPKKKCRPQIKNFMPFWYSGQTAKRTSLIQREGTE